MKTLPFCYRTAKRESFFSLKATRQDIRPEGDKGPATGECHTDFKVSLILCSAVIEFSVKRGFSQNCLSQSFTGIRVVGREDGWEPLGMAVSSETEPWSVAEQNVFRTSH